MNDVWGTLIEIQQFLIKAFEDTGEEIFEPGMDQFNQPGWINRVWTSKIYRRAHVDVVDARDTKGLWMMHCCIFPKLDNNGPIFGLDVISGKNKITGFFHDYSPSIKNQHTMIDDFGNTASKLEWKKQRQLPDWAKAIFSDHMIAAGNVSNQDELKQILDLSYSSINYYLNTIGDFNMQAEVDQTKTAHNRYAYYQKQNPHTPRTMTALGLNQQDVEIFIQQCLFPEL